MSFELPLWVFLAPFLMLPVGLAGYLLWPRSPKQRQRQVHRWALQNLGGLVRS